MKYRRRSEDDRPRAILGSVPLEVLWIVVPFLISMTMFVWGAALYYEYGSPPENATEIYVIGKQWMFHTQHPGGQRTGQRQRRAGRRRRLYVRPYSGR